MLKKLILSKITDVNASLGLLILRLSIGGLMLSHGYPKLMNLMDGKYEQFPDPLGIGNYTSLLLVVFAELACSALLIIGAFTRLVTIPLIITMLVAVFIVHADDGLAKQELGLIYLCAYLTFLISGPGKFSVDRFFSK